MNNSIQKYLLYTSLTAWYILLIWGIIILIEKDVFSNFFNKTSIPETKIIPPADSIDNQNYSAFYFKNFTLTAYCPGRCCNGKWAGMTSKGIPIKNYLRNKINIAAVDPEVIPLGSIIIYNNKRYLAADTGAKIKGKRVDILLHTHPETIKFGRKENINLKILFKK